MGTPVERKIDEITTQVSILYGTHSIFTEKDAWFIV